ncbi:MAG: nitrous oxide reductase accessory protein NosL [Rhodoferax sp.]|jgi:copper chaperone NosL
MTTFRFRIFLASLCATAALCACGDRTEAPVAAVEIDSATTCDLDGMLLADYPGPKAQIHFKGEEKPAFYCDTIEMFNTLLKPEQVKPIRAVLVQDMGKADWDQPRANWFDARNGIYVLGSKRRGSMGPTIASFLQEVDAQAFASKNGGKVLHFSEITRDMVDLSGGAMHDTKM